MLILHLSDLHFDSSDISTQQDPNIYLRSKLLDDIDSQQSVFGTPDIIVVSGDIANKGDRLEFEYAKLWFSEVCKVLGSDLESIPFFICPGNHDIDRSKLKSQIISTIHQDIIKSEVREANSKIRKYLKDKEGRDLLYRSLGNYNDFALQFLCSFTPPEETVLTKKFLLGSDLKIEFCGLNTTFLCGNKDKKGNLCIDTASMQIVKEPKTLKIVVAHHPPNWLKQENVLKNCLNDVAHLQMFGHEHVSNIKLDGNFIQLHAGATFPNQEGEQSLPSYNLVDISKFSTKIGIKVKIKVCTREWNQQNGLYESKIYGKSDIFEKEIVVDIGKKSNYIKKKKVTLQNTFKKLPRPGETKMELRKAALKFTQLKFSKKLEIAGQLDLLEESDNYIPNYERFRRVFYRANEQGKLNKLIQAVEKASEKG